MSSQNDLKRKIVYICADYGHRTNLRQNHLQHAVPINSESAEALWPVGVFLPPVDVNDLGYSWHETQREFPNFYKSPGKSIFPTRNNIQNLIFITFTYMICKY